MPDSPFDLYGTISWEDEKTRLDNFAIHLQRWENLIGYMLVIEQVGGCPGEGQARAIRAKRYLVEHWAIATNRVVWRVEGYGEQLSTLIILAPREIILSYPFRSTIPGQAGPFIKSCKLKLKGIKKSKW